MPLDEFARCILEKLSQTPMGPDKMTTLCCGGSSRLTSPRLTWLEGLGMIENLGTGSYGITSVGKKFLKSLAED